MKNLHALLGALRSRTAGNPNFHDSRQRFLPVALTACLLLGLWPLSSHAQGLSGITGTITDDSGAVVPEATVTATNTATNIVHTAVTTSQGSYYITDLNPGTYRVKIEKAGFQTAVLAGVNVFVSQTATADAILKTGATTTTVEVTAP